MRKNQFVTHRMASAISLAVGSAASLPLYAQDAEPVTVQQADPMVMEEVVVTGIRSSLRAAMDTKRDSFGVVDAITSEDIGKFPDTNLAESLQRITGVSIDRQRGEGSEVTVRGFGADFNLVTLNGRQMPTHGGTNRAFDFADIASESVSSVEVFKTGRASVPTGGIGATINIKTMRPLENPGLTASVGVKGMHDTSTAEGDDWTPEVSGIWSQTFLDDTVGISLSGSFQERHSGEASFNNPNDGPGWENYDGEIIPDNGLHDNKPPAGSLVNLPRQAIYRLDEWERTRINGQLTLQWRPIDSVTATLDYHYAELELDHTQNNMSIWFNRSGQSGTWKEGPSGVYTPVIYTEAGIEPDFPMGAGVDASKNERDSIGFNLVWDVNESLSLAFDYHDSTAKREPNSKWGSSAYVSLSAFGRESATIDFRNDIPVLDYTLSDPLTPDDMRITGSEFYNEWAQMDVEQFQFDGEWQFNDRTTVRFGLAQTELDNFNSSSRVQRLSFGESQASAYGTVSDLVTPASLKGIFDEIDGGNKVQNQFFIFDMVDVIERAEFLQNLPATNPLHLPTALAAGDCGTGLCPDSTPGFGNQLNEETTSAYLELNYAGEMFDLPYNLRVGYRYEETKVTSSAESEDYSRIEWGSPNEFVAIGSGETIPSELEDDYDVSLPSVDFDIDVMDDVKLRASYSQTIARSGFDDLEGNLSIGTVLKVESGAHVAGGSVGNPGLLPHESENWDLSAEWYYGDQSYVSVGYFNKTVENFVTASKAQDVVLFNQLAHPALGPLWDSAAEALGSDKDTGAIREYILANFPNEEGVNAATGVITGVVGRDDPAYFDVNTQKNSDEDGNIDGWEIAWQHDFTETGFGFIVNATFVDGDATFDNASDEEQFALPGLSDTRNFIGYYDKHGLQVRIAYNWRDEFFVGGGNIPEYTAEYEQWDVNASYEVMDGLTIFAEGINVTDETVRTYARNKDQVYFSAQTGPRYTIGLRYIF